MNCAKTLLVFGFIGIYASNLASQNSPSPIPPPPQQEPRIPTNAPLVPEEPAPLPALRISEDESINTACHLNSVKESLEKQRPAKKQLELIEKFNRCVEKKREKAAHKAQLFEEEIYQPKMLGSPPPPRGGSSNSELAQTQGSQSQHTSGEQLTQSAWGTPDACATGTAGSKAAKGLLYVHRSLVLPKQATDDFGYRLGRRFLVYQVSVTNASPDFEYEIGDIMIDLKPIFTRLGVQPLKPDDPGEQATNSIYQASSQDLTMLRGVPEKGQDYDPRNMTLHVLQGIGSVGAGVSGLTPFSDVMGPAMANFNGAFIQALTGIAPDHTSTQLNRLSDMAFTSNTLVGKLQTKNFAVFIPEDFVMYHDDVKDYWKYPRELLNRLPFDQLNVCVDGILLVQAATTPDPTFSTNEKFVAPSSTISLADSATNATIYYTADGSTPTTSSTKYSTPIAVGVAGSSLTIKAFAVAPNESPSNTVVGVFTSAAPAAAPTIACGATGSQEATIAPATANDTVYYTEDGTTPGRQSKSVTASTTIKLANPSETIEAVEVGNNSSMSPVVSQTCP